MCIGGNGWIVVVVGVIGVDVIGVDVVVGCVVLNDLLVFTFVCSIPLLVVIFSKNLIYLIRNVVAESGSAKVVIVVNDFNDF